MNAPHTPEEARAATGSRHPRPHVVPLGVYVAVGLSLLVLTAVTVGVARMNLGVWNVVLAFGIAGVKAALVALFFMHLKYDNRFYATIAVLTLTILVVFISLTMVDTERRGDLYAQVDGPIQAWAVIYDADGKPLPLEQRDFDRAGGQKAEAPVEEPFELRHGFGPLKEELKVGPIDPALAAKGAEIFPVKCATCHRLDERYTGPPLRGVALYRSPTFIMNQILDPAQNVAKHPDMQGMLAQYMTYMTFQNVTYDDARALLEYLRQAAEELSSGSTAPAEVTP